MDTQADTDRRELAADASLDLRRTYEVVTGRLFDRTPRAITIDRFVVVRAIGAGGMGRVYLAHDPALDRNVALKMISTDGDAQARAVRRNALLNEARALAKLADPHVVAIYGAGVVDDDVYIAMEYVAGGTLESWIAAGPHRCADAIRHLAPAAHGLAAAHGRGIIHRDFKPANVLVATDGTLKVADFGLAHSGDPSRGSSTSERDGSGSTPAMQGTPAYMAPEQWQGQPLDARADQYAFCVVLFEALHGRRPDQAPSRARGRPHPIPAAVSRVLARGLAEDPRDRFAGMSALLEALQRAVRGPGPRVWIAITGAGAAGVGLSVALIAGPEAARCDGASNLADAWDAHARARAVATRDRVGRDVAPHLIEGLDTYAASWIAAHDDACTTVDDAPELFDRRMACLDERRRALAGLTGVLADADARVLAAAAEAATELPTIETCSDLAALRRRVAEPDDPRIAAEVAAVRDDLARAAAWLAAGRHQRAHEMIGELEPRARATDYTPLAVEVAALAGLVADDRGDYGVAHERLADAYPLAVANGQDELATRLAIDLVFATGERLALQEQAEGWARQAQAWLDRTEQADTALGADLHSNLGTAAYRQGDYARARTEQARALALRERLFAPGALPIARSWTNLGLAEVALGELDAAAKDHGRALAMVEQTLGPVHPTVAEVLVNLGVALDQAGDHDAAIARFERAAAIQERVLGGDHPRYATTLESLAIAHRAMDRRALAVTLMERALAIRVEALGHDHPEVAISWINLAVLDDEAGEHARAVARYDEAIAALRRAFGGDHPHVVTALHNQALAHAELGQLDLAAARIVAAIDLGEAVLGPEHPIVAGALDDHGGILLRQGQPERALALHRRALASYEASIGPEHEELVLTLAHLGRAELALGQTDAARGHFERAVAIGARAWGTEHPRLASARLGLAQARGPSTE